jgi:hypothetical protein
VAGSAAHLPPRLGILVPQRPKRRTEATDVGHFSKVPPVADSPRVYWPIILASFGIGVLFVGGVIAVLRLSPQPTAAPAALPIALASVDEEPERAPASSPQNKSVPANSEASPRLPAPDREKTKVPEPPPGTPHQVQPPSDKQPEPAQQPLDDPFADPTGAPPTHTKQVATACSNYGTSVNFVDDPQKAAEQAIKENKLLFVLHVAGNFEDSKFT